jgi:hypothetical protein
LTLQILANHDPGGGALAETRASVDSRSASWGTPRVLLQGASPSVLLLLHKNHAESAPAFCNGLVWRVKVGKYQDGALNGALKAVLFSSVPEGVFRPNGIYAQFPVKASVQLHGSARHRDAALTLPPAVRTGEGQAGDRYISLMDPFARRFGLGGQDPTRWGIHISFYKLKTTTGGRITWDNLFSPEAQLAADDAITFRLTLP